MAPTSDPGLWILPRGSETEAQHHLEVHVALSSYFIEASLTHTIGRAHMGSTKSHSPSFSMLLSVQVGLAGAIVYQGQESRTELIWASVGKGHRIQKNRQGRRDLCLATNSGRTAW